LTQIPIATTATTAAIASSRVFFCFRSKFIRSISGERRRQFGAVKIYISLCYADGDGAPQCQTDILRKVMQESEIDIALQNNSDVICAIATQRGVTQMCDPRDAAHKYYRMRLKVSLENGCGGTATADIAALCHISKQHDPLFELRPLPLTPPRSKSPSPRRSTHRFRGWRGRV
jgi:hypothetical protein